MLRRKFRRTYTFNVTHSVRSIHSEQWMEQWMAGKGRVENLHPFKPGKSGNPGGRPKGIKLSIAYEHILGEEVPGDPQNRTYAELIALAQAREAMKGKTQAAIEMADRTEGKVRTSMEITGAGGMPLLPGSESIAGESDEALAQRKQKLLDIVNGKKPEEDSE